MGGPGLIEIAIVTTYVLLTLAASAAIGVAAWSLWRIAKALNRSVDLLERLLTERDGRRGLEER